MADFRPGTPEQEAFLRRLLDAGHLIESGVPGVYGRGDAFERVRLGFDARVTAAGDAESPERMVPPPLLPRRQIEDLAYLKSFTHLACTVFAFEGDEEAAVEPELRAEGHEDWAEHQRMTELGVEAAARY